MPTLTVSYGASNSYGDYYRVGSTEKEKLVTVKHTLFKTFVCLACRTADACEHADAVEAYVEKHGPPTEDERKR